MIDSVSLVISSVAAHLVARLVVSVFVQAAPVLRVVLVVSVRVVARAPPLVAVGVGVVSLRLLVLTAIVRSVAAASAGANGVHLGAGRIELEIHVEGEVGGGVVNNVAHGDHVGLDVISVRRRLGRRSGGECGHGGESGNDADDGHGDVYSCGRRTELRKLRCADGVLCCS